MERSYILSSTLSLFDSLNLMTCPAVVTVSTLIVESLSQVTPNPVSSGGGKDKFTMTRTKLVLMGS